MLESAANTTILYLKKYNIFLENSIAIIRKVIYTSHCCGMIAKKREVAVHWTGFSVERMSS